MAHYAVAGSHGHKVTFKTDQAASGHFRFDGDAGVVVFHVGDLAFALGDIFHYAAEVFFGNFDPDLLEGLAAFTVDFLIKHGGTGD